MINKHLIAQNVHLTIHYYQNYASRILRLIKIVKSTIVIIRA